jgi:hypothetical protein
MSNGFSKESVLGYLAASAATRTAGLAGGVDDSPLNELEQALLKGARELGVSDAEIASALGQGARWVIEHRQE